MRKAQFFYLLRRGLLSGGLNLITEGLVMASKFITQGLSFPAQGSAEFNGTSDYIETPNLSIQSSATWTIGVWVYHDFTSNDADYLFDARKDTYNVGFGFYTTNGIEWIYYDGNGGLTTSNFSATNGEWYYISIVRDGSSSIKIYKDGSLTDTLTGAETSYNISADFHIGIRYSLAQPFEGNMSNFAAWNRALSSDEINSVMWKSYEALSGAESNGLQAWYSLDDITSPAASLANMEQLAADKEATIENKAAITAAINALS